ncbi:MAG: TolC family protein [Spirochaetaceae bacterium]|jgi:outer membrane protein TolC|nr:TolC family protein [Spirochaetaceae bacterium]
MMSFSKKRIALFHLLVIMFLLPNNAQETLGLQKFLELTGANDPEFPVMLTQSAMLSWENILDIPAEDWTIGVSSELEMNFPDTQWDDIGGTLSLSRQFKSTGTIIDTDYTASSGQSGLSFYIGQELAQGAFGRGHQYNVDQADINQRLARFQLTEVYEDYLAAAASIWFDWQLSYAGLQNAQLSYEENQRLLENVRRRAANSIASSSDVDRSLLQMLTKEETLITAQADYQQKTLLIHRYTGLPEALEIIPEDFISFPENWEVSLPESAKNLNTRSSKILQLLIDTAENQYLLQQDDILPSVQLYLNYDINGSGYNFENLGSTLSFGISAEIDWPNPHGQASLERLRLNHLKEQQTADSRLQGYWWDLRLLYSRIELIDKLLISAQKKSDAAQRVYQARNEDYRQGRCTLTELISDQNSLQSARHVLLTRKINSNALRLEWFRLTDQLVTEIP